MLQKLNDHIRDCYERAAECAKQAGQASNEIRNLKADFIIMERSWIHLARTCEFDDAKYAKGQDLQIPEGYAVVGGTFLASAEVEQQTRF